MVVCENGGLRMQPYLDHIDIHGQQNGDKKLHCERFDDLGHAHAFSLELGDFARWVQDENFKPCLTWKKATDCRSDGSRQPLRYGRWQGQRASLVSRTGIILVKR